MPRFALPEIVLGVFPPAGSVLLPARVGLAPSASSLMTGETITAGEWHRRGLVQLLAAPGTLGVRWTRGSRAHSRRARRPRCDMVSRRCGWPCSLTCARYLPEVERLYLNDLMRTHDAVEGIAAFMDRRQPVWIDE